MQKVLGLIPNTCKPPPSGTKNPNKRNQAKQTKPHQGLSNKRLNVSNTFLCRSFQILKMKEKSSG
jgi:hypothetical protein